MASLVYKPPYAFSQTGKLFSLCSKDGKIKVWDTGTGQLKQEYTKNLHLSSLCTCLIWVQVSKSRSAKKLKTNTSTQGIGDVKDVIALGTVSGTVMLYSVEGNTILSEVTGHTSRVNSLTYNHINLYSCSDDKYIIEWDLSKHKVKSKWKDGKNRVKCILVLSCGKKLLSASSTIKLWNLETKEVLKSFVGHATEVLMLLEVPGRESYFVSAAAGDRTICAWCTSVAEESNISAVAGFNLQDSVASLHVGNSSILCGVTDQGVLQVFQHKLNGTISKPIKPKWTVTLVSEGSVGKAGQTPLVIQSALTVDDANVLIAYGNSAFLHFETLVLSELKSAENILVRDLKRRFSQDELTSKMRVPQVPNDVEYITPVQTTPSAVRKGKQRDVPLERRLENLQLASPAVADAPRKDNMAQLLVQGLQSRDRDVIQDVLFRREPAIINTTVRHLPVQALYPLLKELTTLLQGKTFTSKVAVQWLVAIIQNHTAVLLSNPELSTLFQPLLSVVEAKVAGLPGLLRLRGRLALVTEQITTSGGRPEDNAEPLITYQDRNQSDVDSDSSVDAESVEEWDEFSEMEDPDD